MSLQSPLASVLAGALLTVGLTTSPAMARQNLNAPNAPAEDVAGEVANAPAPVDPKWLERLPDQDRALIEEHLGFAPPAFTEDLVWHDDKSVEWSALRGRVVILQTWTNASAEGRRIPGQINRSIGRLDRDEYEIVLLHTPEGQDDLPRFLSRSGFEFPIALDGHGTYSDLLGAYRKPVNMLVDRQGAVRYAGLNPRGLRAAAAELVAETFDPAASAPMPRATAAADGEAMESPVAKAPEVAFPAISGSVGRAKDIRGQRAPDFYVDEWISNAPNASGKVVVLDFWATWCGPCVASIPHMNDLAQRFQNDVVVVGLSSEGGSAFDRGLQKLRKKPNDFAYPLALDSSRRMAKAVGVEAIPHCVVMSQDWIVRWQGNPRRLTSAMLERIVNADRAQAGNAGSRAPSSSTSRPSRNRWASGG